MTLREDQIQRYGRQILLREVGGAGQRKLLSTPVSIHGWSEALEVAATYLAAGGTPLAVVDPGPHRGFLHGTELSALSPDARSVEAAVHALVHPTAQAAAPTRVVVGAAVGLPTAACEACWALCQRQAAGEPASPVAAGALAALLVQRQVLGFTQESTWFEWVEGTFKPGRPPACPLHTNSVFPVQE